MSNALHREIGLALVMCGGYLMAIGGVLRALQGVL